VVRVALSERAAPQISAEVRKRLTFGAARRRLGGIVGLAVFGARWVPSPTVIHVVNFADRPRGRHPRVNDLHRQSWRDPTAKAYPTVSRLQHR
jgi:hypothetical protein